MKTLVTLALALTLSIPALAAEKSIFDGVADDASTGNGSYEIGKYNKKLDKDAIEEMAEKELKKEYWDGCGPWKVMTGRREAFNEIDKVEEQNKQDKKAKTAEKLRALYDKKHITAVVGALSNHEVECSLSWFNVYGDDGTVLKLRYNEGD